MFNKNKNSAEIDMFFEAVSRLKNKEECKRLFVDLCTIKELEAIAQRLEVAKMLKKGDTYTAIASKIGASTATISRVNRALTYGYGGYDLLFDRLGNEDEY